MLNYLLPKFFVDLNMSFQVFSELAYHLYGIFILTILGKIVIMNKNIERNNSNHCAQVTKFITFKNLNT